MDKFSFSQISKNKKCFIIAEIGLAHEGSLGIALKMIEKCHLCGVDAVKFQTHNAEDESSQNELFRTDDFNQDKTRFDYWKRTSFSKKEWLILKKHAESFNLKFLSTPFSLRSAKMLDDINVELWKISSGDINNLPLLDFVKSTKKPVIISSGMSDYNEIKNALDYLNISELMLFQCTNSYPCPPEKIGFDQIKLFKKKFGVLVGLSDHSGEIASGIAAYTLGASAIEVHVTWDKGFFGPDTSASLTFKQLEKLVDSIRFLEKGLNSKVNKDDLIKSHKNMRLNFMKSAHVKKSVLKGHIIQEKDLEFKKPNFGYTPDRVKEIIGRKLKKDLKKGEPIKTDCLL